MAVRVPDCALGGGGERSDSGWCARLSSEPAGSGQRGTVAPDRPAGAADQPLFSVEPDYRLLRAAEDPAADWGAAGGDFDGGGISSEEPVVEGCDGADAAERVLQSTGSVELRRHDGGDDVGALAAGGRQLLPGRIDGVWRAVRVGPGVAEFAGRAGCAGIDGGGDDWRAGSVCAGGAAAGGGCHGIVWGYDAAGVDGVQGDVLPLG